MSIVFLFIALLGDITTAQTAVGLRKTPIIHREKRHTYGAAWLSTMARLLRVAEKSGDPAKLVSNLEAGTYQFTGKLPGCGRKKDGFQHARDVLDFMSVHLGALHRLEVLDLSECPSIKGMGEVVLEMCGVIGYLCCDYTK